MLADFVILFLGKGLPDKLEEVGGGDFVYSHMKNNRANR